jgi:hypothetical protein
LACWRDLILGNGVLIVDAHSGHKATVHVDRFPIGARTVVVSSGVPPYGKGEIVRNGFTPIETAEISETELDGIAGGIASAHAGVNGYGAAVNVGDVVGTVQSVASVVPVAAATGLVSVQTTGI